MVETEKDKGLPGWNKGLTKKLAIGKITAQHFMLLHLCAVIALKMKGEFAACD